MCCVARLTTTPQLLSAPLSCWDGKTAGYCLPCRPSQAVQQCRHRAAAAWRCCDEHHVPAEGSLCGGRQQLVRTLLLLSHAGRRICHTLLYIAQHLDGTLAAPARLNQYRPHKCMVASQLLVVAGVHKLTMCGLTTRKKIPKCEGGLQQKSFCFGVPMYLKICAAAVTGECRV
jgi:hypothetical protein